MADTWRHYLYGFQVLDAEQVKRLPIRELGAVAPVTCELLADWGYDCEHSGASDDRSL